MKWVSCDFFRLLFLSLLFLAHLIKSVFMQLKQRQEHRACTHTRTHHIATSFTEIKFIFRHFRCINNNDDLYDVLGSSPFLYTLYVFRGLSCHRTTLSFHFFLFFRFFHLLVRFWSLSYLFACSLTRSLANLFYESERSFIWLTFIDDSRDIAVVRCWNMCVYSITFGKTERNDCMRFWTDNSNYEFHVSVWAGARKCYVSRVLCACVCRNKTESASLLTCGFWLLIRDGRRRRRRRRAYTTLFEIII